MPKGFQNLKSVVLVITFMGMGLIGTNLALTLIPSAGQTSSESIALVDSAGAKFPLDRNVLTLLGAGIFRTKSAYRINGPAALLRIKESASLKFEVAGTASGAQIRLFRLSPDPNGRILTLSRGKATGGRDLQKIPSIAFSLSQADSTTTSIQPREKLSQGEYGFLLGSGNIIHCFAIEKD